MFIQLQKAQKHSWVLLSPNKGNQTEVGLLTMLLLLFFPNAYSDTQKHGSFVQILLLTSLDLNTVQPFLFGPENFLHTLS